MTRGRLRIYLGAAPGVGKTFAMLDEGWRRAQRSTDVVVGYVETHNRARTAAQLRDLEVVPRRAIEYRGQSFEEMDIDAVLARRPTVALVDELAHTNVPGSRNAKRWQDIEELLAAGIDVISTVNIQHLESLNDVVEGITGIKQQETVPDSFVRDAEQVEIVDMTPEALRRRMVHGNIYAQDKIESALGNYFRVGNLNALRELALLWMADKVDEALIDYRERHGIAGQWETKERVVVALTGAPGGDNLVRRAARTAGRLRGELLGVHVKSGDGLTGASGPGLENQRLLLHELGGRYIEVVGDDIGKALVHVARSENATQVLLGATRRSRWSELIRGSVINSVVRASGDTIDVHIISKTNRQPSEPPVFRPLRGRLLAHLPRRRQIVASAFAAVGLPLLTIVLSHFRQDVGLQNALLCYLLVVVAVATVGGALPAAVASVAAFFLLNWFFAPPIHTFTIGNGRDVLALVSFLVVAGVISALVDVAARRQSDAYRAQGEARALALMSGTLLQDPEPLPRLTEQLTTALALDGASVLARTTTASPWHVEASSGPDFPTDPESAMLAVPLGDNRVLALRGRYLRAEHRELIGPFATQLTLAIQGRRLQAEAATAASLAKANELRTALLAAVSHDLRTPLASIRAAATALLSDEIHWEPSATKELLGTIDDEADRLNTLVGNLLDMSRLQTGTFTLHTRPVGVDELVSAALLSLHHVSDRVEVAVSETLPPLNVDAGLLERAVANLIDNALRFSPAGRPVRVEAVHVDGGIELKVIDHGPGIAPADRERVFQAFQRLGDQPNGSGVGLGLAVAKGLIEATGGSIEIAGSPGGGCTMIVRLPVAS